jgi:delta8-fatty-acid desaturase
MRSYRIGRVEGRWDNFIPPIQGGKFRRKEEQEHAKATATSTPLQRSDSESSLSDEPSPVFEPLDPSAPRRRYRQVDDTSSVSSMEMDEPKMSHLNVRTRAEIDLDKEIYPPLDHETQDEIVRKYRLLNNRIKAEGLYQCNYSAYAWECLRYGLLFLGSQFFLRWGWTMDGWPASTCYILSATCLGLFWHQLTFTAHDAGHMGITHNFHVDTLIGILVADFIGGLSIGWWKRNHNVHHIVTNAPEHDPDIQHMPFFAITHRFFESLRSTYYDRDLTYDAVAKVTLRFQHFLYYPLLCFGRFNLYVNSWTYLLTGQAPSKGPAWWHRWVELLGQVVFWTWFGYGILYRSMPTTWDVVAYTLVSHLVAAPVHLQIVLSHFAMSTADLGVHESFPQKMLRTTMDVDCPPWLDFVHGGLQFQVIHHLYPRIPRHNLRRTQGLVQAFCEEVGIPYALYGFGEGNRKVVGRLADVARQAAILRECQRRIVESGDWHMH